MTRRARDKLTLDLFQIPQPRPALAGNVDLDVPLREALNDGMRHAEGDRHAIAAEMSRLTGRDISRYMLDAYTGESRADHNFPFRYAAAFEQATGSYCLTNLLAKARGCRVLVGEDALLAELGRIEREEQDLKTQKAALRKYLREHPTQ